MYVCVWCCRENILKTAKALVEDTKTLVAGAASNQEQLAAAAQAAVKTTTRLADVVKTGAGSLGPDQPEAQVSVGMLCWFDGCGCGCGWFLCMLVREGSSTIAAAGETIESNMF